MARAGLYDRQSGLLATVGDMSPQDAAEWKLFHRIATKSDSFLEEAGGLRYVGGDDGALFGRDGLLLAHGR